MSTNVDAPLGLQFYQDQMTGGCPQIRHYTVDSGQANVYRGQLVKLDAGGDLVECGTTFTAEDGTAGTAVGVANAWRQAGEECPVILARAAEFTIQGDDDWSPANEAAVKTIIGGGLRYGFSGQNSGNALGESICELDGNDTPAALEFMQIIGWSTRPDNYFGPFQRLIIRLHPSLFDRGPFHVNAA